MKRVNQMLALLLNICMVLLLLSACGQAAPAAPAPVSSAEEGAEKAEASSASEAPAQETGSELEAVTSAESAPETGKWFSENPVSGIIRLSVKEMILLPYFIPVEQQEQPRVFFLQI